MSGDPCGCDGTTHYEGERSPERRICVKAKATHTYYGDDARTRAAADGMQNPSLMVCVKDPEKAYLLAIAAVAAIDRYDSGIR